MEDVNKMLEEQQRELERIRNKRGHQFHPATFRKLLNIAFLLLAFVGVAIYFSLPDKQVMGLSLVAIGMVLKVIEFFLRFLF